MLPHLPLHLLPSQGPYSGGWVVGRDVEFPQDLEVRIFWPWSCLCHPLLHNLGPVTTSELLWPLILQGMAYMSSAQRALRHLNWSSVLHITGPQSHTCMYVYITYTYMYMYKYKYIYTQLCLSAYLVCFSTRFKIVGFGNAETGCLWSLYLRSLAQCLADRRYRKVTKWMKKGTNGRWPTWSLKFLPAENFHEPEVSR